MSIRIVTDSSCDLPDQIIEQYGICVVPLYVNIGADSYLDGVEISRQEFYAGLPGFTVHPTTSVPSPGRFHETYARLVEQGATGILSIHVAGSLSAVVNVARLAAQESPELPITVFDSGQLTLGTGLLVLAAAKAAQAGQSIDQIVVAMEARAARTYALAALDTLEFLRRSGRLNRFQSSLGSVLQIKPVIKVHAGELDMERVRTGERAVARLVELAGEVGPLEELAVVHTHAPERAEALWQKVSPMLPQGYEPLQAEVTPVIGTHVGPGAVGLVVIGKGG